jgi:hypothetical protein
MHWLQPLAGMKPAIQAVTQRIAQRSATTRQAYLARIDKLAARPPGATRMGCANVAHAFAALPANDKLRVVAEGAAPGIVRPTTTCSRRTSPTRATRR